MKKNWKNEEKIGPPWIRTSDHKESKMEAKCSTNWATLFLLLIWQKTSNLFIMMIFEMPEISKIETFSDHIFLAGQKTPSDST